MCGCSGGSSGVKAAPKMAKVGASAPRMQESQAPGECREGDVMVKIKFREGSPRRADGTPYGYMVQGEVWCVAASDLVAHSNWFQLAAVPEPA